MNKKVYIKPSSSCVELRSDYTCQMGIAGSRDSGEVEADAAEYRDSSNIWEEDEEEESGWSIL